MATWPRKGDRPYPFADQDRVMLRVWSAYRCMLLGTAGRDEWADLSDAINMVEALSDMGKLDCRVVMPKVTAAIAGMVQAIECPDGMRMPPEGLAALAEICSLYDISLLRFSANTLEAAKIRFIREVERQKQARAPSTLMVIP